MKALKNHEIFENRAIKVIQKFPYNLQKCVSASSLGGYIHKFLWKAVITLSTWADYYNKHLLADLAASISFETFAAKKSKW